MNAQLFARVGGGSVILALAGTAVVAASRSPASTQLASVETVSRASSILIATEIPRLERSEAEAEATGLDTLVPGPMEVAVLLHRCGLSADRLAAAGVRQDRISSIVDRAREALIEQEDLLTALDASYADARRSADALTRRVRSGRHDDADIAALAQARSILAAAETERDALVRQIGEHAAAESEAEARERLITMRGNATRSAPAPYLVVDRSEAEWLQLRELLAIERIATNNDEEVPGEARAALDQIRAEPVVAEALSSFDDLLPLHQVTWNLVVGLE